MFTCLFDRFLNRNVHVKTPSRSHMRVTDVRPISILLIRSTVTRSNRLLTHLKYTYSRQIHNLGSTGEDSVGFNVCSRSSCEKQMRTSVIGVMWGMRFGYNKISFVSILQSHNCNSLQFVAVLIVLNTLDWKVLDNKIGFKSIVIFRAAETKRKN